MARDYAQMYKEKLCSAEEAVKCIQPGDWVDYAMFNGKPIACDKALAARKDELSDIKITVAVTVPPIPEVLMKDPAGKVFTYNDWQFSAATRALADKLPNVFYYPTCFGEAEGLHFGTTQEPVKAGSARRGCFIIRVAPMDKNGYFNFGIHNSVSYSEIRNARNVIVEVNKNIPRALGGFREQCHISEVTHVVESDNEPLYELPIVEPTEVDRKIAENVIPHLFDGCTIQLGIGGMPNLLGKMIAETDLKDLGGNTEMLVDAYMDLIESGRMNNRKKNLDEGKLTYTFALGGKRLYDWVDNNSAVASCNVGYVNHPTRVAQMENLISINQALQVDLLTQVNAESTGLKQISGNGGMSDFVNGAFWSKNGRSLICLPSTFTKKDGTLVSRIVPTFEPGSVTTVTRQMVNFIVTEYGWVTLKGAPMWQRTEELINISHPQFRDDLIKAAAKMGIWRQTNKIPE